MKVMHTTSAYFCHYISHLPYQRPYIWNSLPVELALQTFHWLCLETNWKHLLDIT